MGKGRLGPCAEIAAGGTGEKKEMKITVTTEEYTLLKSGLYCAQQWELSYADAHEVVGGKKLEPMYSTALKTAAKYVKLRAKIIAQGKGAKK